MTRFSNPVVHIEDGRPKCLLPLYDESDRVVGLAEWWDDERRVIVGLTQIPRRLSIKVIAAELAPAVDLEVEVVAGVPKCRSVAVQSADGGPEVTRNDLRSIDIKNWIEVAVANAARDIVRIRPGGYLRRLSTDKPTRSRARQAVQVARRPNVITDDFLKRVAAVYTANIDGKPVVAVALAFNRERQTAAKYVMWARRAGHLPLTTKGRKRARG